MPWNIQIVCIGTADYGFSCVDYLYVVSLGSYLIVANLLEVTLPVVLFRTFGAIEWAFQLSLS